MAVMAKSQSELPGADLYERVTSLGEQLKNIILGEVEQVETALTSITDAVATLEQQVDDLFQPRENYTANPAGDDNYVAKISKISDEDPQAESNESPISGDETPLPENNRQDGESNPGDVDQAEAAVEREPSYQFEPLILSESEIDYVNGFVEEAAEHIEAIESALLEVERDPDDTAKIDDLFRLFHTIKKVAGFLNLRDINSLTHEAETLLDQVRKGKRKVTPGIIDTIFDVIDLLQIQIFEIRSWAAEPTGAPIPQPPIEDMINRLREIAAGRIEPDDHEYVMNNPEVKVGEILIK